MSEFDFLPAPLGVPGNPLDGTPGMQTDLRQKKKWWAPGDKTPLRPPGRLDYGGMADVGTPTGSRVAQEPQELLVPDVVSATDPAYSQHPIVRRTFEGLAKIPTAQETGSPWTQYKGRSRAMGTKSLLAALQPPGMDALYSRQGANPYG